ncbi:pyruvate formate lyase activating enzyme [Balnearium lithotrophicum]|uniref:Pyruvate formate lyase activating enzyme n=1 Tax=Balnearium lithotrophicum TaxID=223788 RepID=A0A521DWD3_9BACT|nr:radical SAM protein [Balnearium lithotrophicum]SMO76017.1 pyruvate formate lyase activating enzyme [Balnearium lithotrophicum]
MKLSPFLKVDTPTSFRDHPGVHSILFYTDINLCNLNCFQCHNRYFFSKLGNTEFMNYEELSQKLSMAKLLGVELVIVSGGEPTLEPNLEEGLSFVKERGFPIRLDTNGTNPKKLEKLIKNRLIDGIALDVKIPLLDEYTPNQKKRFKRILFSEEEVSDRALLEYTKHVEITINLIMKYSLPFTILRTVEYPLLTGEDKSLISESVKSLPHQFNPFYPVEE